MPKNTALNPEYKKTAPQIPEPYAIETVTAQDIKPHRFDVARRQLTAEVMESRASAILDVVDDYLRGKNGDYGALKVKLAAASLKDVGIFSGILTDKMLTLKSQQPNQWSPQEATKADELLLALMNEVKSRGLTVTATERKIEVGMQ